MYSEEIGNWVERYESIERKEADKLRELVGHFPWFHAGQILLAKSHKNLNLHSANNLLKQASLYAGDRSVLYDFMNNQWSSTVKAEPALIPEVPLLDQIETTEPELVPKTAIEETKDEILVEDTIEQTPEVDLQIESKSDITSDLEIDVHQAEVSSISDDANEVEVSPSLEDSYSESAEQEIEVVPSTDDARSELDKAIQYDPIEALTKLIEKSEEEKNQEEEHVVIPPTPLYDPEKELTKLLQKEQLEIEEEDVLTEDEDDSEHSFDFWLDHIDDETPEETIELEKETEADSSHADENNPADILEAFIKNKPTITRAKKEFFSPERQAKKGEDEDSDLISETLAGLYRKQGLYSRAIAAYEKLSLQNPQKEAYFARLIKEVKKAQNLE